MTEPDARAGFATRRFRRRPAGVSARDRSPRRPLPAAVLVLAALIPGVTLASGIEGLERPGPREFIADEAGLIGDADRGAIAGICGRLLDQEGIAIVVATVRRMGDHAQAFAAREIDRFARILFNQWGIGDPSSGDKGILLLVSQGDRKARIELGVGWGRGKDARCRAIMDAAIIPRFKRGDFSGGIRAGVSELDLMARGKSSAVARPGFGWSSDYTAFAIALGIGLAVGLILWTSAGTLHANSRYARGRAFHRRVRGRLDRAATRKPRIRRERSGALSRYWRSAHYGTPWAGGGFSGGGSFGGGSSGGGGATGGW